MDNDLLSTPPKRQSLSTSQGSSSISNDMTRNISTSSTASRSLTVGNDNTAVPSINEDSIEIKSREGDLEKGQQRMQHAEAEAEDDTAQDRENRESSGEAAVPATPGKGEKQQNQAPPEQEDPFLVTLKGREHINPHTWNSTYRWFLTALGGVFVLNATFASSAPSQLLPSIIGHFHVSEEVGILTIALFVAGYCVGPLFWG